VTLPLIGSSHAPLDALGTASLHNFRVFQHPARPALHAAVAEPAQQQLGFDFQPLDGAKINSLSSRDKAHVEIIIAKTNQAILAKIVILPSIMFLYFLNLGLFFRRRAGYRQVELVRAREEGE